MGERTSDWPSRLAKCAAFGGGPIGAIDADEADTLGRASLRLRARLGRVPARGIDNTSSIQVVTNPWNPTQYGKFSDERSQPFHDLVGLVRPAPILRAVDLGCGSGELTALAAERLAIANIVGIDNSPAMLQAASTAVVVSPLAFDAGVLPLAGTGVGVAQTHGVVWLPSSTGPPRGWLVMVRLTEVPPE